MHFIRDANVNIQLTKITFDVLGELTRAEKLGLEALRYLPEDSSIHFNLGNTMGKQQKFEQAEHYFKKAISLKPGTALYHTNLGNVLLFFIHTSV